MASGIMNFRKSDDPLRILVALFALVSCAFAWSSTTQVQYHRRSAGKSCRTRLWRSATSRFSSASPRKATSSDEVERLRESASKLRQEADTLSEQLGRSSRSVGKEDTAATTSPSAPVTYKELSESSWTLTYRFSSEPEPQDDDTDENAAESTPRSMYSGKLSVKFRSDGYSELISHAPTGSASLNIEKVWGWDEETSEDDDLQYVLFSVNAKLPSDDASTPNEIARFYWQAQVKADGSSKNLSLVDGTVTVKKDIKPPGGFWGVFDGGGILAQFRYAGNFVAKPMHC